MEIGRSFIGYWWKMLHGMVRFGGAIQERQDVRKSQIVSYFTPVLTFRRRGSKGNGYYHLPRPRKPTRLHERYPFRSRIRSCSYISLIEPRLSYWHHKQFAWGRSRRNSLVNSHGERPYYSSPLLPSFDPFLDWTTQIFDSIRFCSCLPHSAMRRIACWLKHLLLRHYFYFANVSSSFIFIRYPLLFWVFAIFIPCHVAPLR